MSLYSSFETDKDKEIDGVDFEYYLNDDGSVTTVKLARMGARNPRFLKAYEKYSRPYEAAIASKRITADQQMKININTFVETSLRGWDNLHDRNGQPIPFNVENAIKVLTEVPEWFMDLQQKALEKTAYLVESAKADAKN